MEVDREYREWKGDAAERWGQARDQDRAEIHPLKERLAVCLTALVSVLQSISVHTLTSSSLSAAAMTLIVTVWPKRWLLEGGGGYSFHPVPFYSAFVASQGSGAPGWFLAPTAMCVLTTHYTPCVRCVLCGV